MASPNSALRATMNKIPLDNKDTFLDNLIAQLSVKELAYQLPQFSANLIVGVKSDHADYDKALHLAPYASIGILCDWYPIHPSQFNALQAKNLETSQAKIPLMQNGECLHSLWTNKHTVFPQALAMSCSFEKGLLRRIGRALATEARAVGVHVALAPVLDIAKEPRYGRCQETFGEDYVLTSHLGVAYCSGLSKDGRYSDQDAVIPTPKHLIAHGSPSGGLHSNWWVGRGRRELLSETLIPFKAVFDLGSAKAVMMSYTAVDDVPSHINPFLYKQLEDWGFDGFVISDWCGLAETVTGYQVEKTPADAIKQWLNLGGSIFLYDFDPDTIIKSIVEVIDNGSVELATLQKRVRKVLEAKYNLGLFHNPFLPNEIDHQAIVKSHMPLALEAARKSIVLLENRDRTLPIRLNEQGIKKIAIVGPFADTFNYGTYSGTWGATPIDHGITIRQGMLQYLKQTGPTPVELVTAWGANNWNYNVQYPIPGYLLSAKGSSGGLQATYFCDTEFQDEVFQKHEMPNRDWGVYPPVGLPSNDFSVVWEGELEVPTSVDVNGYIGVAVSGSTSARLFIDGGLIVKSEVSESPTILKDIMPFTYSSAAGSAPPPGSAKFLFRRGAKHRIRIEYQTWVHQVSKKLNDVHSKVQLWWNLVDRKNSIEQAEEVASDADVIVLAVGAAWNSDAENGDRATLTLSKHQMTLADKILALGKPVVLVLEGGRPFAIPDIYAKSAAVLSTGFLGQAAGAAIADVLFGEYNPSGRLTMSIPYDVGSLPAFYNQRITKDPLHIPLYVDIPKYAQYSFGYGLSYTAFSQHLQSAFSTSESRKKNTFGHGDIVAFHVSITNTGYIAGSQVPQIYLLRRVGSSVVMANKQLVAFDSIFVDAGDTVTITMELEVDRYLPTINREFARVLEAGEYSFVLADDGSLEGQTHGQFSLSVEESYQY